MLTLKIFKVSNVSSTDQFEQPTVQLDSEKKNHSKSYAFSDPVSILTDEIVGISVSLGTHLMLTIRRTWKITFIGYVLVFIGSSIYQERERTYLIADLEKNLNSKNWKAADLITGKIFRHSINEITCKNLGVADLRYDGLRNWDILELKVVD